jgi:hypothetical protein
MAYARVGFQSRQARFVRWRSEAPIDEKYFVN